MTKLLPKATPEQRAGFTEASRPLVEWMQENMDGMADIEAQTIVTSDGARLLVREKPKTAQQSIFSKLFCN